MTEQAHPDRCYFCTETDRLHKHHIVPRRFGGSDESENLVAVCPTCHSKLENLYDKRFYDALGVRKVDQDKFDWECDKSRCKAPATTKIPSGQIDYYTCDKHKLCNRRGCEQDAVVMVTDETGGHTIALCDSHEECQYAECGATEPLVIIDPDVAPTVVCEGHKDGLRGD